MNLKNVIQTTHPATAVVVTIPFSIRIASVWHVMTASQNTRMALEHTYVQKTLRTQDTTQKKREFWYSPQRRTNYTSNQKRDRRVLIDAGGSPAEQYHQLVFWTTTSTPASSSSGTGPQCRIFSYCCWLRHKNRLSHSILVVKMKLIRHR